MAKKDSKRRSLHRKEQSERDKFKFLSDQSVNYRFKTNFKCFLLIKTKKNFRFMGKLQHLGNGLAWFKVKVCTATMSLFPMTWLVSSIHWYFARNCQMLKKVTRSGCFFHCKCDEWGYRRFIIHDNYFSSKSELSRKCKFHS